MKRLVAISMTVILLLSVTSVLADDTKTFEPTFTNQADYSARKWFGSKENRALLTIMLALDYISEKENVFDFAEAMAGTTYVAYHEESNALLVCYLIDEMNYSLVYVPSAETAIYIEPTEGSELATELAFEEVGCDYYRNSQSTILEVSKLIQESIGEI
ncbi:MAG: hypothetical protein E7321_01245 [Clostridiales bacterium]|nr:hypothetical protein [Clostridiales bacterium]